MHAQFPQKASEPVINASVQMPGFDQANPWHQTPGCLPSLWALCELACHHTKSRLNIFFILPVGGH